ncbi:MAG: sugar phosphate isomerase/epimerase family protein [Gemmataceae bacterium]
MWIGYNSNGFAHHKLEDAIEVLAELGYEGVALTLDHNALSPFDAGVYSQLNVVRSILKRSRMKCVVETGARFLLDRRHKHQPTLLSPESHLRAYRLEFLERAVYLAAALGAECVSFWSGTPSDDAPPDILMDRLVDGCRALADTAAKSGVRLAFEPEPGMFVDTMDRYALLFERVGHPQFGLTLDVGHLHCQNEPIPESILQWRNVLWNVHVEDMRRGVHEHLMFGEGEMDFGTIVTVLDSAKYCGGLCVELSRHSHNAVETARKSLAFLRALR